MATDAQIDASFRQALARYNHMDAVWAGRLHDRLMAVYAWQRLPWFVRIFVRRPTDGRRWRLTLGGLVTVDTLAASYRWKR